MTMAIEIKIHVLLIKLQLQGLNFSDLLFMYWYKYISLTEEIDTLPPPPELDKKGILVISLFYWKENKRIDQPT